MLQNIVSFIKEKAIFVAFFILLLFFIQREYTRPKEVAKTELAKLVPTTTKIINGMQHQQAPETVISEKQFKEVTKEDKKKLKAHKIFSETTIVDKADTSYKNSQGVSMPNDTISIKRYDTRKWFLAPLVHKIDITHSDTTNHTISANSITYKEPRVLFVIGPFLGWDMATMKPAVGVAITWNVFSIKSKR